MRTLKRSECAVLSLVLKRKWFEMIERGEKREEYRDATVYWGKRILDWWLSKPNRLRVVEFRMGYARNARRMAFVGECVEAMVRCAHPEWGEPEGRHFIVWLGERVEWAEAPDGAGAAKPRCCGNRARPRTWREVPHSPLPFRDGGCNVFVGADGHVVGRLERAVFGNEEAAMRFNGDYRYMLCAVNCHEALVEAAKKLLVRMKGRDEDTEELRALIARAEEHFE